MPSHIDPKRPIALRWKLKLGTLHQLVLRIVGGRTHRRNSFTTGLRCAQLDFSIEQWLESTPPLPHHTKSALPRAHPPRKKKPRHDKRPSPPRQSQRLIVITRRPRRKRSQTQSR